VSWNLGVDICHVELDTPKLTQEQVDNIEKKVNQEIRSSHPVIMKELSSEDLKKVENENEKRVTITADDMSGGPIRLIEIEGIDSCTCCGTHVSNTSELQAIKFFHTEKMRGNTRLFFIVGNRLLKMTQRMFETERQLTLLLNVGPTSHIEFVDRLQKQGQGLRKVIKSETEEIAQLIGEKLIVANQDSKAVFYHREEGDFDFVNTLGKSLLEPNQTNESNQNNKNFSEKIIFLSAGNSTKKSNPTTGSNPGEGIFLLLGKQEEIDRLAPLVLPVLGAKGGGKKGRLQAKATALSEASLKQVEEILKS